jgi:hypothetical protein
MQCVRNCHDPDPKKRSHFEQPVIQTLQMFIGEMGSWLVIAIYALYQQYDAHRAKNRPLGEEDSNATDDESTLGEEDPLATSLTLPNDGRQRLSGWKVALLAIPASCDIAGTTLMNVGLLFVAASIYQMTRGALVLFVGLFSVLFLNRRLGIYKWFALFVVVGGVALVGVAGALEKHPKPAPSMVHLVQNQFKAVLSRRTEEQAPPDLALQTTIGVLLIAAAQIFTATQFVVEESIMHKYSLEPLKAVGWEGFWGFVITAIGMVILHFAYGQTAAGQYGYFDAREGLSEVFHNKAIAISSVLIMISIG